MTPRTLISLAELAELRDAWGQDGARVAFVPTMGALHQGHLTLALKARALADRVIVSIFVNPLQFGPSEDFERYPRTLKTDLDLLEPLGVDAVFLPNAATMYPEGFQTNVVNREMSQGLCGASRKGHFDGVLTVVLKLFMMVRPHIAIFGKKDYQQFRLIECMVRDLNLRLEVVGAETLREPDGLAMSSRNRYLSDTERKVATRLYQGLSAAQEQFKAGRRDAQELIAAYRRIVDGVQGLALEYAELRRQRDLAPVSGSVQDPVVLLTAAKVGTTRLIDNLELG